MLVTPLYRHYNSPFDFSAVKLISCRYVYISAGRLGHYPSNLICILTCNTRPFKLSSVCSSIPVCHTSDKRRQLLRYTSHNNYRVEQLKLIVHYRKITTAQARTAYFAELSLQPLIVIATASASGTSGIAHAWVP
jgi:hypothetical protein